MREEHRRLAEAVRASRAHRPDPDRAPVVLDLPFEGSWWAPVTPAHRVPSHRTHFLGQTYAIDFVAVDERMRTSPTRDWRTVVAAEPADRFYAFGRPILSPAAGRVVAAHDGEADHSARRSPLLLVAYLLTQGGRLRRGLGALVGNHVILALGDGGPYVVLAHLRRGSLRVRTGDAVVAGQVVGACGNSGNSTQPHLHIQVMDSLDLLAARGVPMSFRNYLASPRRDGEPRRVDEGIPGRRERVEPLRNGPQT